MLRTGLVLAAFVTLSFAIVTSFAQGADVKENEGKPIPSIELKLLDGKTFNPVDAKEKVLVIDIWATWCPPCVKSLPHIQALSKDKARAEKGLVIVAANTGEDEATINKFMTANSYTFQVAVDQERKLGAALGVRGIPTSLVIGRDGIVKNVFVGFGDGSAEKLDEAIDKALAETAPASVQ